MTKYSSLFIEISGNFQGVLSFSESEIDQSSKEIFSSP